MRIGSLFVAGAALALTTLCPAPVSAAPMTVEILASGPALAGSAALGSFDFTLAFDAAFVVQSVSFGSGLNLGDPAASLQFSDDTVPGQLNAFELSFVNPATLMSLQSDAFRVLSLILDIGSTPVGAAFASVRFSSIILGDAIGDPLEPGLLHISSPDVRPVPEPAAILLVGPALGLWWRRSRWHRTTR